VTKRLILLLLPFLALRAFAVDPNDETATLSYFLSRSELVVIGTITSHVIGWGHGPIRRPGIKQLTTTDYSVRIDIQEVLFGHPPPAKSILAQIHLRELHHESRPFQLEKDGKYLFFLAPHRKESTTKMNDELVAWEGADLWFGVMPYDPALAETLRKMPK
jgi:hypothetical protein